MLYLHGGRLQAHQPHLPGPTDRRPCGGPPPLPAGPEGPRCPARLTPPKPALLRLLQPGSSTHRGILLPGEGGGGEAGGLIRQFLKTKELDIWLLPVLLLPSSQLQNKPEPRRAPSSPRGRGRTRGSGREGWGHTALPLRGQTRRLGQSTKRGAAQSPNLKGRPQRGARVAERLSPLFLPAPFPGPYRASGLSCPAAGSPPVPTAAGAPPLPAPSPAASRGGERAPGTGTGPATHRRHSRAVAPTAPLVTHPSIAEQDKARASGTDSRAGRAYGETVRKWRPGLHENRRTLPSAGVRSPSPAATERAPAAPGMRSGRR